MNCNEKVEVFPRRSVKILGHRGDPRVFRENSLDGIRSAAESSHGVEVDLRRCGTGELLLAHDPTVAGVVIAETPIDVLTTEFGLDTAEDLFAANFATILDLEIKNWPFDPGFEPDGTIGLEVAARSRDQDLVTSFHWPTMDTVKAAYPSVVTGLLFERAVSVSVAVEHAVEHGHDLLAPHHGLIDEAVVAMCRDHGLGVAAWTVDDRQQIEFLQSIGVDTIITNVPADAMEWIQEDRT